MKFHGLYRRAVQTAIRLLQNPAKVLELIRRANQKTHKTGGKGAAMEKAVPYWKERMHLLGRMVKAYIKGDYTDVSYTFIVKAVAALVYFVWIFDLIPDMIPGVGLVDDATVFAWLLSALNQELDRYQEWEEANNSPGTS
jgi:uncharacterized membrane protein YkvA (DUF1232 family)